MTKEEIETEIRRNLNQYIDTEVKIGKDLIKSELQNIFDNFKQDGIISDVKVAMPSTLWKTLTFRQKITWFLFRYLFKKERLELEKQWEDVLTLYDNVVMPDKPYYLVDNPKQIIMCESIISLNHPVKFVTLNIKL